MTQFNMSGSKRNIITGVSIWILVLVIAVDSGRVLCLFFFLIHSTYYQKDTSNIWDGGRAIKKCLYLRHSYSFQHGSVIFVCWVFSKVSGSTVYAFIYHFTHILIWIHMLTPFGKKHMSNPKVTPVNALSNSTYTKHNFSSWKKSTIDIKTSSSYIIKAPHCPSSHSVANMLALVI